jgi:glutathione S-transferase
MILIGQYDSPFVRRVGIALRLYGIPFQHKPWSTFSDADKFRALNPLTRVPTLVLDKGDVLIESHAILDHIDSLIPADKALFPRTEPARHQALKVAALACGLGDKAVALFYEKVLHKDVSDTWVARCSAQILDTLALLEAKRAARSTTYWFGEAFGHADIVVATVLRHFVEAHPGFVDMADYPALSAHAARMEAMPVFQEISQPFIAPT